MKHGDFLCFMTRIVEKSWKNREKFLSSENPSFQLRLRAGSVENSVPVRLPPRLTFPYPGPVTAFEVRDNASFRCFRSFSTIFPRSEAKIRIVAAIIEFNHLHKDKNDGPITLFDATGPSFTRSVYLRYRFPRQPSAFNGSPSAHGGRRHIKSHSSWTEPNSSGTSATSSSCTCRTTG